MSYRVILYHVVSYRIMSFHIVSYHIISYNLISYHIIPYRITSSHLVSYHIISYHIMSYHIVSYHIISYHIILSLRIRKQIKRERQTCFEEVFSCPTVMTEAKGRLEPFWIFLSLFLNSLSDFKISLKIACCDYQKEKWQESQYPFFHLTHTRCLNKVCYHHHHHHCY